MTQCDVAERMMDEDSGSLVENPCSAMVTHWGSGNGKSFLKYLFYFEIPIRVAISRFQLTNT